MTDRELIDYWREEAKMYRRSANHWRWCFVAVTVGWPLLRLVIVHFFPGKF